MCSSPEVTFLMDRSNNSFLLFRGIIGRHFRKPPPKTIVLPRKCKFEFSILCKKISMIFRPHLGSIGALYKRKTSIFFSSRTLGEEVLKHESESAVNGTFSPNVLCYICPLGRRTLCLIIVAKGIRN